MYRDERPGNLRERAGLDPHRLAAHVDGFLVPLCSVSYETTYWVESLARGFARELEEVDASFTIQLSASDIGADRLVDLTEQVSPYADAIVYGTHRCDIDVVRDVVRRYQDSDTATLPA